MDLFITHEPQKLAVPIVANLPHSGLFVPDQIATQFLPEHLATLPHSDWHLEELYRSLPTLGITVLQATHSRYVIDLNREAKEPLFGDFWTSAIPEKTAFGKPIYQTLPTAENIQERVKKFYNPYHNQLGKILQKKIDQFGKVYLLDLHSFLGLIDDQICLGNRYDRTCSEFLISTVEQSFSSKGYQVVRNKVFSGGYITRRYGKMPDVEALQIEVRYPVYLNENQLDHPQLPGWNGPEFAIAQGNFDQIFAAIVHTLCPSSPPTP
ncbi:MAG: N-formylglutamate amidohydrolase [Leptolyngbyaceae cyanobacterium CSU_1_3]|nr:N-formylglutamate amidohydrolase [Leptolyngbyaceae cyanobacterium CSU_1_3]